MSTAKDLCLLLVLSMAAPTVLSEVQPELIYAFAAMTGVLVGASHRLRKRGLWFVALPATVNWALGMESALLLVVAYLGWRLGYSEQVLTLIAISWATYAFLRLLPSRE